MTVTVIDYGLSNLLSVRRALEHVGASVQIADTPEALAGVGALVLPGVGAFGDGMAALAARGLAGPLRDAAADGVPLLGICLGMQMLFEESDEFGRHPGLALLPGRVEKLPDTAADGQPLRVPHVGWGPLLPPAGREEFGGAAEAAGAAEFAGLAGAAGPAEAAGGAGAAGFGAATEAAGTLAGVLPGQECYFVHSYEAKPALDATRLADTLYGGRRVAAAVGRGRILGCQFHPEKSGPVGLAILAGFLRMAGG